MFRTLEQVLAFHCAPALVGIKPANLVSCDRAQFPSLELELAVLNRELGLQGFCFWPICCCENRVLLLVFRRKVLEEHLCNSEVRSFLLQAGYPDGTLQDILLHLQEKLSSSRDFPHETGVILGYPVQDVKGYLLHGGRNCKFTGYWKVYTNEHKARALFHRFTCARKTLYTLVSEGASIVQLFHAA